MADLDVKFHENRLMIRSQAFCCDVHDTWANRKVLFVLLRALCSLKTGKPLFSYQTIAEAFQYKARQNINNFVREYEGCDENFFDYLRHKRKVDPLVVDAVTEELRKNVLSKSGELRARVNQRLQRTDLTSENIRAALEQIPCTVMRQVVLREIEQGAFHPKEAHVLAEVFAALESDHERTQGGDGRPFSRVEPPITIKDREPEPTPEKTQDEARDNGPDHRAAENAATLSEAGEERRSGNSEAEGPANAEKLIRYGELVAAAGIEAIREESDEAVIQKVQADSVQQLLTPDVSMSDIPEPIVQMVKGMTLYYSNSSLSRIGQWFGGKSKSTIYNWVIGLAVALWPVMRGWVWHHVKGTRIYIDEKWLKIRKKWRYWFVAVDQTTGLPVFHDLVPTRSKWGCRLFLLKLKRLGKLPSEIMTDGLKSYVSAIAKVFPHAKHLLCLFHHQQGVTRCVNTHFSETEKKAAKAAKKRMKQVVQTNDTRTVKRRLARLEKVANQKGWDILNWIQQTRDKLKNLLPALRSNSYPTTTNEIERFFRAFTRFYKTRCGFHSVKSAKRELIFFLVVYFFTIQVESGKAPIERIIPNAKDMPFYHLLNYPFADSTKSPPANVPDVKPIEEMATQPLERLA